MLGSAGKDRGRGSNHPNPHAVSRALADDETEAIGPEGRAPEFIVVEEAGEAARLAEVVTRLVRDEKMVGVVRRGGLGGSPAPSLEDDRQRSKDFVHRLRVLKDACDIGVEHDDPAAGRQAGSVLAADAVREVVLFRITGFHSLFSRAGSLAGR